MPKLPALRPSDLERILLRHGFRFRRQKGSHRIYDRVTDGVRVVLPWHSRQIKTGLLVAIAAKAHIPLRDLTKKGKVRKKSAA